MDGDGPFDLDHGATPAFITRYPFQRTAEREERLPARRQRRRRLPGLAHWLSYRLEYAARSLVVPPRDDRMSTEPMCHPELARDLIATQPSVKLLRAGLRQTLEQRDP